MRPTPGGANASTTAVAIVLILKGWLRSTRAEHLRVAEDGERMFILEVSFITTSLHVSRQIHAGGAPEETDGRYRVVRVS